MCSVFPQGRVQLPIANHIEKGLWPGKGPGNHPLIHKWCRLSRLLSGQRNLESPNSLKSISILLNTLYFFFPSTVIYSFKCICGAANSWKVQAAFSAQLRNREVVTLDFRNICYQMTGLFLF